MNSWTAQQQAGRTARQNNTNRTLTDRQQAGRTARQTPARQSSWDDDSGSSAWNAVETVVDAFSGDDDS